jgi:probable rRNA maturation factor
MTSVVQVHGIHVEAHDDQDAEPIDLTRWADLLARGLDHEGVTGAAEANLVFVDRDTIARLKVDHLDGDGEPTDVLAFPIDAGDVGVDGSLDIPRMVGDIVICPAYARANTTLDSLDDEIALLVVHGLLHLLGHDHADPDEKTRMRAHEQVLLDRFHR